LNNQYAQQSWLDSYAAFPGGQTNEHFIVWMRASALPTLVKTYMRCNGCRLEKGSVNVLVNNSYPFDGFRGNKWFGIAQESSLGTRNAFFPVICFVYAALSLMCFLGIVITRILKPRQEGDVKLVAQFCREYADRVALARSAVIIN
jgi:hypothetical protein